ncbi:MAG: hypothetical protein FWG33_02430 [Oscillospiraceae bacterium]|nr:hypothetical protein [Oscillospiraceae bacterium]
MRKIFFLFIVSLLFSVSVPVVEQFTESGDSIAYESVVEESESEEEFKVSIGTVIVYTVGVIVIAALDNLFLISGIMILLIIGIVYILLKE